MKNKLTQHVISRIGFGVVIVAGLLVSFQLNAGNQNMLSTSGKSMKFLSRDTVQAKMSQQEKVYDKVDQMPQFPEGMNGLARFLNKNLRYPFEATKKGIGGTVVATFVVTRTGEIQNPRIIHKIGGGCDEEILRVISLMPKWEPGKQDGKEVAVQYILPIKFSIQKNE